MHSHAQGTRKAQQKGFVCEEIKEQVQNKEIKFLDYVIQSEQIKKNSEKRRSQELAFVKTSQESTSLSEVDELLSKVCT
jgi:hypothetical protein